MAAQILRFLGGLLLAPLFAMAVMTAAISSITLIWHAVDSRGDWDRFEGNFAHYLSSGRTAEDGSLVFHETEHAVAKFVALIVASWALTFAFGYALERLRRSLWRDRRAENGAGVSAGPGRSSHQQ